MKMNNVSEVQILIIDAGAQYGKVNINFIDVSKILLPHIWTISPLISDNHDVSDIHNVQMTGRPCRTIYIIERTDLIQSSDGYPFLTNCFTDLWSMVKYK